MSLEYTLIPPKSPPSGASLGNQFHFMALVHALDLVGEKPEYEVALEYFPRYNGGGVPAEHCRAFLKSLKKLANAKIPVYRLIGSRSGIREQWAEGACVAEQVSPEAYNVLDARGFQVVADRKAHAQHFVREPNEKAWPAFEKQGVIFEWDSQLKLEEPVVVFQAKKFTKSLWGYSIFYEALDSDMLCLIPGIERVQRVVLEEWRVEQHGLPLSEFNYIFKGIVQVAKTAVAQNAEIQWR